MSIKKKLILMGICIVIIIVVLSVNVIRRLNEDKQGDFKAVEVKEDIITRAEAYRLLSYLDYDRTKREAIPVGITYADSNMSDWYDTYVNAVWKMGLIEGSVTISPKKALTYGECKELIDKLIIKYPQFQSVYQGLSFNFSRAEEDMPVINFLELYSAILAAVPQKDRLVKEDTLLVLGRDVSEEGKDRMVTDLGKFYYLDAKSYEEYFNKLKTTGQAGNSQKDDTSKKDLKVTSSPSISPTVSPAPEPSQAKKEEIGKTDHENVNSNLIDAYMDQGINVLVCGQEIVYITAVSKDKITVHNVWIEQGKNLQVNTFVNGIHKSFSAKSKLSSDIEKVVGDITIENQKIVQISVKPDTIHGKVLLTGKNFIEIEGYGKVTLDDNYKIYKIYGDLSMEPTSSILVGYKATDFIVSGGKISAALIKESIKAQDIRVLLRTTGFKDIYHSKVELTASAEFTISSKKKKKNYSKGEKVTIKPGDDILSDGRVTVTTSEKGKIQILSIERSNGNPKYRGSIEIAEGEEGLLVVNELPLEEYLYAVIPSEMPSYYGMEALKAQAVCARSYAYRHLLANSLNEYGAHVDDSVAYQVYNNIPENEDSVLAVKDTYGKVINYNGDVITAYYFSTSCGHTTGSESVWANGTSMPYLTGKLMTVNSDDKVTTAEQKEIKEYQNLSDEDTFRSFLKSKDITTYDSKYEWYRWKVSMSTDHIKKVIDNNLAGRYNANPALIQTMTQNASKGKDAEFESIPVDTVGDIVDISALKRDTGGIITELLIKGSKNTIKVKTEYNIRALLAPSEDTVIRQDDSKVEGLSLLPSAYFAIDKNEKNGKPESFTIIGGGYGHGVGMSQNGAKEMADEGDNYEDIISYFYQGTEIGFIYE